MCALSRLQPHHMVCPPKLLSPGGLLCRPHFRVRPASSGDHLRQAEQEEERVWTTGRARWNLVSLSPIAFFMGKCGEDGACDVLLSQRSVFPSQAIAQTAHVCRVGRPFSDMMREAGFQCPHLPGGQWHMPWMERRTWVVCQVSHLSDPHLGECCCSLHLPFLTWEMGTVTDPP